MAHVTLLLEAAAAGDRQAAADLLPLVYDELRKLAGVRLAAESPDQTLQATALVHEAYLRLVGPNDIARWENRGHFFSAAAEAMRRILVENARRKGRTKHGGELTREELSEIPIVIPEVHEDLVALDAALNRLKATNSQALELVHLRYFAGLSLAEAADLLAISPRTAGRLWAYAKAWLHQEITGNSENSEKD